MANDLMLIYKFFFFFWATPSEEGKEYVSFSVVSLSTEYPSRKTDDICYEETLTLECLR